MEGGKGGEMLVLVLVEGGAGGVGGGVGGWHGCAWVGETGVFFVIGLTLLDWSRCVEAVKSEQNRTVDKAPIPGRLALLYFALLIDIRSAAYLLAFLLAGLKIHPIHPIPLIPLYTHLPTHPPTHPSPQPSPAPVAKILHLLLEST